MNNDWTLCTLQSPQEGEEVLLTFKNSVGLHVGESTFKDGIYFYIAETNTGYFEEQYNIPIAWMKKPKPYGINN